MIVVQKLPSIAEVEAVWRSFAGVRHSFFLSWHWIGTWLSCLPKHIEPQLLQVCEAGRTIGAGLLVNTGIKRRGILSSRTWVLNATGDSNLDQIFIEHNGLLAAPTDADKAWKAWSGDFVHRRTDWDEVQLRGIRPDMLEAWRGADISIREDKVSEAQCIELDKLRESGRSFVDQLSRKRRVAVRRTKESLSKLGALSIERPANIAQAHQYFEELKLLHDVYWRGRGRRGCFDFPFFEQFHSRLIDTNFDAGVIQLLRVKAGATTVAVLYNFVFQGCVTAYQCGINYSVIRSANRESPGFLSHVLCIEYNMALGNSRYDLRSGDSQYKRALANASERLWWGRVQRKRLKFSAEDLMRAIWRNWQSKASGQSSAR